MKKSKILVVDDDRDLLTAVRILLRPRVGEVMVEHNPENIPSLLERNNIDLVLLDMNFKSKIHTGNEGLYWLSYIRDKYPHIAVVLITAYGAVDLAVRSVKMGAADFIVKPWQNEQLLTTLAETLSVSKTKENKSKTASLIHSSGQQLLGESEVMKDLHYKIRKIAPTDANILILGENGTGKDLIAAAIHEQSNRKKKAFVKVDVGALTDTLFESELFGYKKGAFTDAREDRKGRFEAAQDGTLFLDEIGNITLQQQAKLLSVLQNRQVIPLGSNEPIPIDIRLVSATNVPLRVLADENRFRKDLVYRINTVEIQVPPLRERGSDVILLARHFMQIYSDKYNKNIDSIEENALSKIQSYHYPGNVRELQYSIERAVIMSEGSVLKPSDILFSPIEQQQQDIWSQGTSTKESQNLEELEKKAIQTAISRYEGNISKAAKELGITRAALYRRMAKYGI